MFNDISPEILKYIIVRHFIQGTKPGQLYQEITDPDAYEKYGIQPVVKMGKQYFYKYLKVRIPMTTVEVTRVEWSNNLLEVPLAVKRTRIEELSKLYNNETNVDLKRKLLIAIKDEVGEEHWQKALEGSGKTTINLHEEILKRLFAAEDVDEDLH